MSNTVIEIGKMELQGTLVDDGWIEALKYDNGKTNLNAVMILAEIVYWHKPSVVKDEVTGRVLGYKKKFKADKLQKSYEALGDRFGLTKRQAKLACDYLREKKLLEIEFRTIKYGDTVCNNVMYVDLNVENLKKITGLHRHNAEEMLIPYDGEEEKSQDKRLSNNIPTPPTTECNRGYNETQEDIHLIVIGDTLKSKTNTKTTSKTTTKTTTTKRGRKNNFNNFEQREYDNLEDIEKRLLQKSLG